VKYHIRNELSKVYFQLLGHVNLISRLSSRVTEKHGAGGRILFHNLYYPKEKLLMKSLLLLAFLTGNKI
jgi:hypothetical protein